MAIQRHLSCGAPKVVVAQFDTDGFRDVPLAREIGRQLFTQAGEDRAQLRAIRVRMQIALESCFAADRLGFAGGHDRAIVPAMSCRVQPRTIVQTELLNQPSRIRRSQFANGVNSQSVEFYIGLGPDAVDAFYRQRPDAR